MVSTMRALVGSGGPDRGGHELAVPAAGAGQVMIRVHTLRG